MNKGALRTVLGDKASSALAPLNASVVLHCKGKFRWLTCIPPQVAKCLEGFQPGHHFFGVEFGADNRLDMPIVGKLLNFPNEVDCFDVEWSHSCLEKM